MLSKLADSSVCVTVQDRYGRKVFLKSLVAAVAYLVGLGPLPEKTVRDKVAGREGLINGRRVFYEG